MPCNPCTVLAKSQLSPVLDTLEESNLCSSPSQFRTTWRNDSGLLCKYHKVSFKKTLLSIAFPTFSLKPKTFSLKPNTCCQPPFCTSTEESLSSPKHSYSVCSISMSSSQRDGIVRSRQGIPLSPICRIHPGSVLSLLEMSVHLW